MVTEKGTEPPHQCTAQSQIPQLVQKDTIINYIKSCQEIKESKNEYTILSGVSNDDFMRGQIMVSVKCVRNTPSCSDLLTTACIHPEVTILKLSIARKDKGLIRK